MFRKRPAYTSEELDNAVTRIERLKRMAEQAERNSRLVSEEPARSEYKASHGRLLKNIASAELYLLHCQNKVNGIKS